MAKSKSDDGQLKAAYEAYEKFIKLCRTLFNHKNDDEDAPAKKINELITKDSEFYKEATAVAKDCGMDWGNLSAEDSDELELIMLDDRYNGINVDGKGNYIININIKKREEGGK